MKLLSSLSPDVRREVVALIIDCDLIPASFVTDAFLDTIEAQLKVKHDTEVISSEQVELENEFLERFVAHRRHYRAERNRITDSQLKLHFDD